MLNSNNFANLSVRPAQPPAAGLPIVPGAPGIEIFGDAMVNQSGGGAARFSSAVIRGGIEVEVEPVLSPDQDVRFPKAQW